ncbi:DUF6879 family protein [Dactylosporangium sp. NPDC005572]|uniref:DUF6879 family protein n=1 Tax=Dactylosporangium sp. NPDC005572 TaxID=3156889 RepID=UPI0033B83E3F
MEEISEAQRDSYFTAYRREALHLEMRDIYATDIERSRFQTWLRGEELDPDAEAEWWRPWFELMAANRAAGKTLRRLRIVSEPVTKYIYFEWLDAFNLVKAGEEVRWLPRRQASTLLLPGNDYWLFDNETVTFTHFSGDGHVLAQERATEPDIVRSCKAAFEAAWRLGIPHHEYKPAQA